MDRIDRIDRAINWSILAITNWCWSVRQRNYAWAIYQSQRSAFDYTHACLLEGEAALLEYMTRQCWLVAVGKLSERVYRALAAKLVAQMDTMDYDNRVAAALSPDNITAPTSV